MTDYYIALGVNFHGKQDFACKSYYWCTGDNLKFAELPCPLVNCGLLFDQVQTMFTGEFEKTIVHSNGSSECLFIEADLFSKVQVPPRGLTELDRLSYVVHQIDHDCHVVPRGAVKKTPLKELRRNEAFKGLKADQAFNTCHYSHFRMPVHKDKVDMNNRNEGVYNNDFLDSIVDDLPKGTWSVMKDTSGTVCVLRSKMWPGFSFYHKVNTDLYGSFYVGNGCKALDMPFMF